MLNINHCLTTRSKITQLKALDNNHIVYATELHGIRLFNPNQCETQINLANKNLNSKTTALTFSNDGKLLAFANKNIIYILYIQTHKIIKTIKTNEIITIITFDNSSNYLICGTKKGRVFQYKYNNSSSLSRLCSFPLQRIAKQRIIKHNFVSAFAIYNNLIATSGYGGAIFIIDILSRANKQIISHESIQINTLCFLDKHSLISGDIEGNIYISSLKNSQEFIKISTPFKKIKQIVLMPNPKYILVNLQTNYLAIVDIKTQKIVDDKYLIFNSNINSITISNDGQILVSLENQELLYIEIPSIQKLQSFIEKEQLNQAFELIANAPMLHNSKEHKILEKKYRELYIKAVEALTYNNIALAIKITDSVKENSYKKHEIERLFHSFKYFSKFNILVLEKKYPLAYAMCKKYPAFVHTPQYKKMELIWKETFVNAQRQMILKRDDLAIRILQEHMSTTSKKPLIKFILNHTHQFLEFLKAIDKKDYRTINTLVNEHTIFAQIPTFISLNSEIQDKIHNLESHIQVGNIDSAKILINELIRIPHISGQIEILHYENKNMAQLQKAYRTNNLRLCYEILDEYPYLLVTQLGELLETNWSKLIYDCEEHALKGDIKALKQTLGKLIQTRTRTEKIGDLLRVSYHIKIKVLITKKSFKNAQTIIFSYIEIFGMDSELHLIIKAFELKFPNILSLSEKQKQKKVARDNWLHSTFILNMMES